MKVELTENAKKLLRKQRSWWRKNRDEKTLFTEAFIEARKRLKNPPKLQVYGAFKGKAVRRLLMESLHQAMALHGFVQIEGVGTGAIEAGEPHIAHDD